MILFEEYMNKRRTNIEMQFSCIASVYANWMSRLDYKECIGEKGE